MTLKQLIDNTDTKIIDRSPQIRNQYLGYVIKKRKRYGKKGVNLFIQFYFSQMNIQKRTRYDNIFELAYHPNMTHEYINKSDVRVYCQCAHFKFNLAYSLKSNKTLIQRKELGVALTQKPVVKNPNMNKFLCKHLVSSLEYLTKTNVSTMLGKTYNPTASR